MPSKKRKYNARFPAGRIKKIMQTDEEVGKVAQAVPIIISRSLELFVESLLKKSMSVTISRNAKTLSPSHVKQCILSESRFDFLRDLVKNIPDVSAAEEREQNLQSAETSPTAQRFTEVATPQTPTKVQPSLPSTSSSPMTAHSQNRHPQSVIPVTEHNGKKTADSHEHNQIHRIELPVKTELIEYPAKTERVETPVKSERTEVSLNTVDLTRRRVPNFYQETLPDSDVNQELAAHQSSVIQYVGRMYPDSNTSLSDENKPKTPLDLTQTNANKPTTPSAQDFTRVPLQSSMSFESALPRSQPVLNFDFTKNLLKPEVKYGSFDAVTSVPSVSNQSRPTPVSSHRSLPTPIQRSMSLVRTSTKEPPPLVPISTLQTKIVPVLTSMELDEDYDT